MLYVVVLVGFALVAGALLGSARWVSAAIRDHAAALAGAWSLPDSDDLYQNWVDVQAQWELTHFDPDAMDLVLDDELDPEEG